jgi:alpha-1,2-mannosyltransferase
MSTVSIAMSEKTKKILVILLLLSIYIPYLDNNGKSLIDKQAWDFPSFYYAGWLTFDKGLTPYNPTNWAMAENQTTGIIYAFLSPPPSLPIFRSLNLLSYENAKVLLLVLNQLLILLCLYVFFFKILKLNFINYFFVFGAVYLFSFNPIISTLHSGQINLVILALLVLTWLLLKDKKHPALVALPLALAIILKLYPALFLIYFLIKKQYKVLFWTLGFLLVAVLVTYPMLPAGTWQDWLQNVAFAGYGSMVRGQLPTAVNNQGINAFTARLFLDHADKFRALIPSNTAARFAPVLLSAIVGLVTFAVIYLRSKKRPEDRLDDEISLILVTMFLVAPISWDYHLTFVIPAILIALYRVTVLENDRLWLILIAATSLLLAFNYPFALPAFRQGVLSLLISAKFFAICVIWLFFVLKLSQPSKVPVSDTTVSEAV